MRGTTRYDQGVWSGRWLWAQYVAYWERFHVRVFTGLPCWKPTEVELPEPNPCAGICFHPHLPTPHLFFLPWSLLLQGGCLMRP